MNSFLHSTCSRMDLPIALQPNRTLTFFRCFFTRCDEPEIFEPSLSNANIQKHFRLLAGNIFLISSYNPILRLTYFSSKLTVRAVTSSF
jgi:hypothetical protein